MLSNLEAQKKDIEDKISSLESQLLQGQIDADEMNRRKAVLFNGLNDLKCKIKERELQLVNARNSLQDVADQKVELEKKATIVEKQLRVNLSELHKKTIGEMQTTAWKVAAEDFVERLQKSKDYIDHLPSNERKIVEDFNEVVFDGSIIEDMALHANEIAAVSSALFLGYLDGAINFTQTNGGGGSSPDPDWGRNKDDDDEAWRRKCFFMGMKMMRPANKQVKQIKNDKGGIRR